MTLMGFLMISAIACGNEAPAEPTPTVYRGVTVPDDISSLDPGEVDRRLERLFGGATTTNGSAAPDVAPTETVTDPSIQEILDALNPGKPSPEHGTVLITVSDSTLSGLANPRLTIKTPPAFGVAAVTPDNQILYTPRELMTDGDNHAPAKCRVQEVGKRSPASKHGNGHWEPESLDEAGFGIYVIIILVPERRRRV